MLTQLILTKSADEPEGIERFKASFSQQSLWLINQFYPDNSAYNLQIGMHVIGAINHDALERSLQEIVNRHDGLRTKFMLDGAEYPLSPGPFSVRDYTSLPDLRDEDAYQLALRSGRISIWRKFRSFDSHSFDWHRIATF